MSIGQRNWAAGQAQVVLVLFSAVKQRRPAERLWNPTYIQPAIDQLAREGWDIGEADIARVSLRLFKHINSLGR